MHDELDDIEESLSDLEPGSDENPMDSKPLPYNPLNHAYPLVAETTIGTVEIMVQFTVVRGESNLPIDMINNARELQVPAIIEDVPVKPEFSISMPNESLDDIVAEQALISEIAGERYYLIPIIVRARRFCQIEGDEPWTPLSEDETAALFPGPVLLDLITGYADKVATDPDAPRALLDLLDHFTGRVSTQPRDQPDSEWN